MQVKTRVGLIFWIYNLYVVVRSTEESLSTERLLNYTCPKNIIDLSVLKQYRVHSRSEHTKGFPL